MENKPIDRDRLKYVCKVRTDQTNSSIKYNLTYIAEQLYYSDVTSLRRQLRKGEIGSEHLDKISMILDVSPDYLSGKVDLLENGEIPTYDTYLFLNKLQRWSAKRVFQECLIALISIQGGDPNKFSDYQISSLGIRIAGIVTEFIKTGDPFINYKDVKEGNENG